MKSIASMALLCAVFLMSFLTEAGAITKIYDVSGDAGTPGSDGRNGSDSSTWRGDNGDNGDNGSRGDEGSDAGEISVRLELVETAEGLFVEVRGSMTLANGSRKDIQDRFIASQIDSLIFRARGGSGGDGGDGGRGGDGGDGDDGRNGSSWSRWDLDGEDGEDGGNGGHGGDGANGADGGRGGDIQVLLAENSEVLAGIVQIDNRGGAGGRGGSAGRGGSGGDGGDGGWRGCYTDDEGHRTCGRSGWDGDDGSRGRGGSSGSEGRSGRAGELQFQTNKGQVISKVFKLVLSSADYEESIKDGVLEPSEKVIVSAITIANQGGMNFPSGQHRFVFPGSQSYEMELPEIPANDTLKINLNPPLSLNLNSAQAFTGSSLRVNQVRVPFNSTRSFTLGRPVNLTEIEKPNLRTTTEKMIETLSFSLENDSTIAYGKNESVGRAMRISLKATSDGVSFEDFLFEGDKINSKLVQFEVESIEAKNSIQLDLNYRAREGLAIGSKLQGRLIFELERNGSFEEIGSQDFTLQHLLGPSTEISFNQKINRMGIRCRYPRAVLGKNMRLGRVKINRSAGSDMISIQYQGYLSAGRSPNYRIDQESFGPVLNQLVGKSQLAKNDVLDLFNKVVRKASSDYYNRMNKSKSWIIESCR